MYKRNILLWQTKYVLHFLNDSIRQGQGADLCILLLVVLTHFSNYWSSFNDCDLNSSNLSKEFHDWYLHHRHISTNTLVLVYAIHDSKKILNGRFVLNYFVDDTVLTCDNVSLFYKFHRHKKFFEWSEWLWNWRPSKDSLYFDCVVYPDV